MRLARRLDVGFMALFGHAAPTHECPLIGEKRTSQLKGGRSGLTHNPHQQGLRK
jgi:hypothetical protein